MLIPYIQIHNANALSSPYTIGFPAMTAWLGAVHNLQRLLKPRDDDFEDLAFKSVGVVCHDIKLQTYKGNSDFVYSIIGTGNPLDKSGNRPSFIEEARCHLTVSIVIEYSCDFDQDLAEHVDHLVKGKLKFAGGDVITAKPSETFEIDSENQKQLMTKLMPGFCLIERRDLMQLAMANGQDAIDALLDYLTIKHTSQIDDKDKVTWTSSRKNKGWIVPIATGFHGISDLGKAENQRDPDTPHRFAESIITLGEFKMPYRIDNLDNMLWHTHADLDNNLYLCQQNQPINQQ
ncbi:type I-F CRISPR-associated protein Csy2 [Methylocucumis oryzae]|uniref:CRISPR-associated protein n=1 Tax=Methylocucumis oryzae TaxID=1632867 RepID=A0A0F3IGF2_9GAMM|nr:type I-F CRISPR-associated protein Csy2 [Methylocucumis oryzae]KJV05880.1 CRISPR-associated protein [Methylocucumis oryzae]